MIIRNNAWLVFLQVSQIFSLSFWLAGWGGGDEVFKKFQQLNFLLPNQLTSLHKHDDKMVA